MKEAKTGSELLAEFFMELLNLPGVDPETAQSIIKLNQDNKLKRAQISAELEANRKKTADDQI